VILRYIHFRDRIITVGYSSALKMEAVCSSAILVYIYQSIRRNIAEDGNLHVFMRFGIRCNVTLNLNSVALVRQRTIPTERPPLVGEVSDNFLRIKGVAWSAQRIPTAVNLGFLDRSRYLFLQVAPQLSSRG
jgi:hypothetical protein